MVIQYTTLNEYYLCFFVIIAELPFLKCDFLKSELPFSPSELLCHCESASKDFSGAISSFAGGIFDGYQEFSVALLNCGNLDLELDFHRLTNTEGARIKFKVNYNYESFYIINCS